jgi:hypothetical protein
MKRIKIDRFFYYFTLHDECFIHDEKIKLLFLIFFSSSGGIWKKGIDKQIKGKEKKTE